MEKEGKSVGTIEVDIETLLETIILYIFIYLQSNTHTQVHVYIPWISESVIKKVGCAANHKYTKYTNLQYKYYKYFTITL